MTTTSNTVTVTVAGVTYTYSMTTSVSPTSLPYTGGTVTVTAVVSTSPSGGTLSGWTVNFYRDGNSIGSETTDSTGTATLTYTEPENTSTTAVGYTYFTSATINGTLVQGQNIIVTIAGISYTYSIDLTASTTSLPYTGGNVTLTATYSSNPTGANLTGINVTFTEIKTGTTATGTTNSSGIATATFTLPADNTTTAESYQFDAVGEL